MNTNHKLSPRAVVMSKAIGLLILVGLSACQGRNLLATAENPLTKATDLPLEEYLNPIQAESNLLTITPSSQVDPVQTAALTEKWVEMITITVLYDNYPYQEGLETGWGFSAFVTYKDQNVLFDTGASGLILLENMAEMNIKPGDIQNVVLSHEHNDHTGGLQSLLTAGADPIIYLPPSFSSSFKKQFDAQAEVIEVFPGLPIGERISTSGEIGGFPPEQALVIDTSQGLVVITGCAHPGVDKMVLAAKRHFKEDIYLVLGGFHLGNASSTQVDQIITEFRRIGVDHVAPCHCTGDRAIAQFKEAFEDHFIQVGTGTVIEIES